MAGAYMGALRELERVFRVKTNKQTPWEGARAPQHSVDKGLGP